MTITTVYLPNRKGKKVQMFLCSGRVGNVVVSVVGHTRAYAIHKAFKEIMRPI